MSHLVRCRGGTWRIWRNSEGKLFAETRYLGTELLWNGTSECLGSWSAPAWLPVAWLCCEANPADGTKFAAAILDAEAGDNAPAIIACDWLERLGAEGVLGVEGSSRRAARALLEELPPDWGRQAYPNLDGSDSCDAGGFGPLASWCRHLIATRCVACGGRRDGEDTIDILGSGGILPKVGDSLVLGSMLTIGAGTADVKRSEADRFRIRHDDGAEMRIGPTDCTLCGYPSHPSPLPLVIPKVAK